ncbi:MAG: hypothetical protein HRT65_16255 [Flavobacteriaceae bacterium]|nr:hypothetical protein [Flavobacteriaceae bacterium]
MLVESKTSYGKIKSHLLSFGILCICICSYAQDNQDIDPSKPTNLYTQINALGEFTSSDNFNTYGTRFNFQYAFDPDNLVLAEVPLLYNDLSNSFGLSDIRVRYFNAIKRNLSESIIALVPFADITVPTGSVENGLGADTWSLAGGVILGVLLSEKVSLFPGINYVYLTAPNESGVGLQTNMSLRFNQNSFVFVNPIVTFFDFDTIFQAEFVYNHIIVPNKFKVVAGWLPNFTTEANTFRIGATFFL